MVASDNDEIRLMLLAGRDPRLGRVPRPRRPLAHHSRIRNRAGTLLSVLELSLCYFSYGRV